MTLNVGIIFVELVWVEGGHSCMLMVRRWRGVWGASLSHRAQLKVQGDLTSGWGNNARWTEVEARGQRSELTSVHLQEQNQMVGVFWPNAALSRLQSSNRASMKDLSYRQSMLKIVQPVELWWTLNMKTLKSLAVNGVSFSRSLLHKIWIMARNITKLERSYKKGPPFTRFACSIN